MVAAVLAVAVPLAPGHEEHGHGAGVRVPDGLDDLGDVRDDRTVHLNISEKGIWNLLTLGHIRNSVQSLVSETDLA